jgi:hypothetical protein
MTGRFGSTWFLSSAASAVSPSRPECATAPRAAAVKTGRRPPPKAAQSGLDGREHGASFDQAGRAAALLAADGAMQIYGYCDITMRPAVGGLPPRPIFSLTIGRKSEVVVLRGRPWPLTPLKRMEPPPRSFRRRCAWLHHGWIRAGLHRM